MPPPRPRRRRKPWWRRLIVFAITLALLGGGLLVLSFFLLGPPAVVAPDTWVEVRFSPTYADAVPDRSGLRGALQPIDLSHQEVLDALRRLARDDRIVGVLLRPEGFPGNWSQANELIERLEVLRADGKRVVVHANGLSTIDAHLASAADRVVLSPEGVLWIGGLQAQLVYLRRALDRIGVEVESVGVGEYKSAPEQFTADASSPESREQIQAYLDDVYGAWLGTLAEARGLTETRVSMLVERGLFDAGMALEEGLIDAVGDFRGVVGDLGDPPRMDVLEYLSAAGPREGLDSENRIALVHVDGTIMPGPSQDGGLSGKVAGAETIVERLERAREDDTVKAVVLRVDSPGGSALASDLILLAADRVRKVKPLVVSMGNTAASGGYYVSMNADRILADPLTLTGSIGVFVMRPNLAGTYEKLDIGVETFARGANAGLFDPTRPWTPGQRATIRDQLVRFYDRFVVAVADGRGMDVAAADAVARGRVWSGRRALEVGLVDEFGSRAHAIEVAAAYAGLDTSIDPQVITYQPKPNLLDRALANALAGASVGRAVGPDWSAVLAPWLDVVTTSAEFNVALDGTPQFALPWRLHVK